tara:strand:+ start:11467 stop:12228 length:762 start_codon:yes stop_codon:yes gene_type:complete
MAFNFRSHIWHANPLNERTDGIHTDTEASNLGFQGAFVPGVTLYEHVVSELLNQGVDWLKLGSASYRFRLPVYNNEPVTFSIDADNKSFQVIGDDKKGPRMIGTFGLEEKNLDISNLIPMEPCNEKLGKSEQIGAVLQIEEYFDVRIYSKPNHSNFPNKIDKKIVVPVGKWCNPVDLITTHFDESTTIHRTGKIWHHSPLYAGETMIRKGIITNLSEHKGHQIVHFSVMQMTDSGRKLATIEHESVYRLAEIN